MKLQSKCFSIISMLFLFALSAFAQQAPSQRPCDTPQGKQLDFWLGEWELTWPAEQWGGTKGELGKGSNSISKILDNCIIQEEFRFPKGNFDGHSVSVYSTKTKKWQQTWVDNQGSYLLFTGEFKEGKMILQTAPFERNGQTFISRMVFKNIKENFLDWDWQRSGDDGQTWTNIWNIHYERKKK